MNGRIKDGFVCEGDVGDWTHVQKQVGTTVKSGLRMIDEVPSDAEVMAANLDHESVMETRMDEILVMREDVRWKKKTNVPFSQRKGGDKLHSHCSRNSWQRC